jgi:hypothetical protein
MSFKLVLVCKLLECVFFNKILIHLYKKNKIKKKKNKKGKEESYETVSSLLSLHVMLHACVEFILRRALDLLILILAYFQLIIYNLSNNNH